MMPKAGWPGASSYAGLERLPVVNTKSWIGVAKALCSTAMMGRFVVLQAFSWMQDHPTTGQQTRRWGVSLQPPRLLLNQLRRSDQIGSASGLGPAGKRLHGISPGHVRPGPDGGAASGWMSELAVGALEATHRFGNPQKRTPWLNRKVLSCRWCLPSTDPPAISRTAGPAKALLNRAMVGATGFEPVTPSVSAKHREPLCSTPFPQVGSDRRCRRETLS
jgi:hypothetical protein